MSSTASKHNLIKTTRMMKIPKETSTGDQALEGLKVADFSWIAVGPIISMCLAHHGAQVIRIESSLKVDELRAVPPFKDGRSGINRAGMFANYNTGKYGLSLNLGHPNGVEVAKKIIGWADIVVESFSPGTMNKLGLGYEDVRKIKPDIIMLSTSMQGQSGPMARASGTGVELISLIGFNQFMGWPDRGPTPLLTAYSDFLVPPIGVIAIMAALEIRNKTNTGQWIDLSQFEVGLHFLAPVLLDYVANGQIGSRKGNSHFYAAPHGTYRCKGDDRWCAISVFTDEEWRALCQVMGKPILTEEPAFASLLCRKKREEELNSIVEEWTINHTSEEVVSLLQTNGIPAGVVESGKDVLEDPQLRHRHHFVPLNHAEMGQYMAEAPPFKLPMTPSRVSLPAPCLGEHSEYVCTQILGMSDEEFVNLVTEGVIL